MKNQIGSPLLNKQDNGISWITKKTKGQKERLVFGNLNPKSRDFKSRLGGCKIGVINGELFSKTD